MTRTVFGLGACISRDPCPRGLRGGAFPGFPFYPGAPGKRKKAFFRFPGVLGENWRLGGVPLWGFWGRGWWEVCVFSH